MLPSSWYLRGPHAKLKALIADIRSIDGPVLQYRVSERRELIRHGMIVLTFQEPLVNRITLEADMSNRLAIALAGTTP